MKWTALLLPLPLLASAVTMDMVLVEEPGQTNQSATAWAANGRPLDTDAATLAYIRSLVATSSYSSAMGQVSTILSGYTDRFSPDWSYEFKKGAGVSVDTLVVRSRLTDLGSFASGSIDARFLSATNLATIGTAVAGASTLRGSSLPFDSTAVSDFGALTAGVVRTTFLDSPSGRVTFDAPATFFTRPPIFSGLNSTNDPPAALFQAYGELRFGHYRWGLLHFATTNNGPFRFNTVSGMGLGGDGSSVSYDLGPAGRKFADWSCVPIVTTLRPTSDPGFALGFWDTTVTNLSGAATALTNSITRMYAAVTNVPPSVAGYTNEAALAAASPSYMAAMAVDAWKTNAIPPAAYTAAVDYVAATVSLINQVSAEGVVNIAYEVVDPAVHYARYRQVRPADGYLNRVSMHLSVPQGLSFPATPARYWLVMNGRRILSHRVSSAGETGPAFAFIDAARTEPGFLYLDMTEVKEIHGTNVLNAASYCVKVELLKGQSLWQP
ncbi:MAG: hypothetical protein WC322_06235 [Candidatus Paceibacterota bacterium]